jgi:PTH1 family peptidyl-tRNA hydrolase
MFVVVGLGNPGKKYENTRHNIGFIVIDLLADELGIKVNKLKHQALVGETRISGEKVLLVKPMTYMNDSGRSIASILRYYDVRLDELIVIYDDVDIPVGTLRIRKSGSAGTHNGMRSILYHTQDEGFPRVRIGVGADRPMGSLVDYVLGGFSKEQKEPVKETALRAVKAVEALIADGVEAAMNRYNG